jgi:hypothetical protein
VVVNAPIPVPLDEGVRHVVDAGLAEVRVEVLLRHEPVQPLAMDRQPGFVGGVEPLPQVLEFQVAGDPHVHAEFLLGPQLVEEVLGLVEGRGEIAGLEGADDVAADPGHLQAGLVDLLLGVAAAVDHDGPVTEAVDLLIEAPRHRAPRQFL